MSNLDKESALTSKLEESLFTLWSLFILCDQNYQSLLKYRKLLDQDFEFNTDDEVYLDTINEALLYQILLRTCSFLDEWDNIFGVQTEEEYKDQIKVIKKIAKPARNFLNTWKGLREFRNQAIAHNHRDKQGVNIYLSKKIFHAPNSLSEFGMIMYSVEKMIRVTSSILPSETNNVFAPQFVDKEYEYLEAGFLEEEQIVSEIARIDQEVRNELFEYFKDSVDVVSYYRDILLKAE